VVRLESNCSEQGKGRRSGHAAFLKFQCYDSPDAYSAENLYTVREW